MPPRKPKACKVCGKKPLTKDEIGATKKILDPDAKAFYCLQCLADLLECEPQDLLDKIEEFKNEGCSLFQ